MKVKGARSAGIGVDDDVDDDDDAGLRVALRG